MGHQLLLFMLGSLTECCIDISCESMTYLFEFAFCYPFRAVKFIYVVS